MKYKKRYVFGFVGSFAMTTLAFWLGGFNFDHRGETLVMWFLVSIVLFLVIVVGTIMENI